MKNKQNKFIILFPIVGVLWIAGCGTKGHTPPDAAKNSQNSQSLESQKPTVQPTNAKPKVIQVQTGRYSAIVAVPTTPQHQLLQVIISIVIPDYIRTVRETIRYVLKRSGYQLSEPKQYQNELAELFAKQLPEVHRHIGPMTLEDALTILTTPAFVLVEDPVHRLISYQLDDNYSKETLK
jgi:type IV pili sensor histidine kinase/response regulator